MTSSNVPPLSETARSILEQRATAMRAAIAETRGVNPDGYAEAAKLAREGRETPETLLRDLPAARAEAMRRETSREAFQRDFPHLTEKLRDVRFLSMTSDDLGNLQTTESEWGWIGRSWGVARDASATGSAGMRAMVEGRGLTTLESHNMRLARRRAQAHAERDNGFLGSAVELVGSMLDSVATGVATGLVSGPAAPVTVPAALFAQSFRLEGGNLYADLVEDGYTPAEARGIVLTYGPVIAGLDVVGLKAAGKPFKALAGDLLPKMFARSVTAETRKRTMLEVGKNYLQAVGGESTTEALQEIVGMLGKEDLRSRKRPDAPSQFDMGQAADVFAHTAKGMMVLGGLGAGGQFAAGMQKAADAQHTARVFENLSRIEDESKQAGRSPDDRAAFVTEVATKHAQAPNVYIDGQAFAQLVRDGDAAGAKETGRLTASETLEKVLPGIGEKVAASEETGADVVLPTGDFISKLGRTEIGRALMQHAKFDPEGMTPAEGRAALAERPQLLEEARAEAVAAMEADEKVANSARVVEQAMHQDIVATGTLGAKEARSAAALYRDFVVTQAARRGLTPEQFHARYPVRVFKAEGQEGTQFEQAGKTDTPEFRTWFGDSKVVDEAGAPLVLHHGTIAYEDFQKFRKGTKPGLLGPGIYFTNQRDFAESYTRKGGGGGRVISAYVRMRNPVVVRGGEGADVLLKAIYGRNSVFANRSKKQGNINHIVTSADIRKLRNMGHDGIIWEHPSGNEYVVFDSTQIKSVNNRGTFDPADPNILRQEGDSKARGGFIPQSLTVLLRQSEILNERADASTALHEFSHAFLTIYGDLAAQGDALARADLEPFIKWRGIESVDAWLAMPLEEQRKHHEAFAYSFETYVFDGKAPSQEMQGLFDRFKVWLRRVYKTIRDELNAIYRREFGEDLPILTGEVRQMMDRMLASEEAIAEAEAVRSMVPAFQTQEASKMDDAQWAAYQQMAAEAREAGIALLDKRSLRQMEWLSGARGRLLKEMQARHKDIRDKVRREVVAEVASRPAVRADRWLRSGRMLNEDGTTAQGDKDANHKLARLETLLLVPDNNQAAERLKPYMVADGRGMSPDVVAEFFGYDTGESMVRDLLAMRPFGEEVDARTDERMFAEHSEFADPAEVEAAVERALHNEVRMRFVATELRHLQGATQPVRVMLAAAKEAAKQAIGSLSVREVSAKRFAQSEAQAARKVLEALRKGDSAAAAEWQQKRLLQHALAKAAGEFEAQRDKDLRNLSRLKRPDAKLAKTRDTDLVNAARWILSRYNLGTPSQEATATRAMEAIKKYDEAMAGQLAPMLADAERGGRDWRDLSVDEFRDLMAKVDGLWDDSRRSQQIRVDGKLMDRAEVRELIVAQLAKTKPKGPLKGLRKALGSVTASLRHVESWALEMDGGKPGPVHKYLFQILRDPVDSYLLERKALANEINDRVKTLPALYGRKIEARELVGLDGKAHVFQNRGELVGFLLHMGNRDNMRIDAVGRGWVQKAAKGEQPDLSPVTNFLRRMIDEKLLTKADFDFAQSVWDTFEQRLKGRAQEVHRDIYGYYFQEIEATAIETPWGEYRGGYMPAKADPDLEGARPGQVSLDGVSEAGGAFMNRHPSAEKGFTITRTGIDRGLAHDIRLVSQAFAEELQFIHLQRPGRDVASLLNDATIGGAIKAVDASALEEMLFPWLQDTMRDRLMAPGGNRAVNRALVYLRRNVGVAYMFGNVANAFQQLTGLATSAQYVQLKYLRGGAKAYFRKGTTEQVMQASQFMRLRIDKRMGQITDDIDVIMQPTWLGKAQGWTQRHGYFLQQWFQAPVDVITWIGAHDQAVAEGRTEAEAVTWADSVVRRSQASGTAADISKFERSSAAIRLLTQFGTFWLATLNTVLQRHGKERAAATASVILFAGVLAGAISQALKGGWDDDDEDGALWDDVAGWAFGEAARTGASLVPLVGPMVLTGVTGDRGGRLSPAATLGAFEQGFRGVRGLLATASPERDLRGQDIKDLATLISVLLVPGTLLPARPASYGFDVLQGNVEPSGPGDLARGLATGYAAPGTRQ